MSNEKITFYHIWIGEKQKSEKVTLLKSNVITIFADNFIKEGQNTLFYNGSEPSAVIPTGIIIKMESK
ncbi:MAG: hypothetical protein NT116_05770 [Candidatus Parcubacteria bacterium]|nr:hypothetical protein [Candidatus Parcubacteria bacterium]